MYWKKSFTIWVGYKLQTQHQQLWVVTFILCVVVVVCVADKSEVCDKCSVFQWRWWPALQTKSPLWRRYAKETVRLSQYTWLSTEFMRQHPFQRSCWFSLMIQFHICPISSLSWVQTRPSWTMSSWLVANRVNLSMEAPFTWWTSTIPSNCTTPLVQTEQLPVAHRQSLKRKRRQAGQTVMTKTSIQVQIQSARSRISFLLLPWR